MPDPIFFVYRPVDGNMSISTRLVSIADLHAFASTGMMVRQDNDPKALYAAIAIEGGKAETAPVMFARTPSNRSGGSVEVVKGQKMTLPFWLRITRQDDVFTTFQSTDGENWTEIGSKEVPMQSATSHAGFLLSEHDRTATITFDNVKVTQL